MDLGPVAPLPLVTIAATYAVFGVAGRRAAAGPRPIFVVPVVVILVGASLIHIRDIIRVESATLTVSVGALNLYGYVAAALAGAFIAVRGLTSRPKLRIDGLAPSWQATRRWISNPDAAIVVFLAGAATQVALWAVAVALSSLGWNSMDALATGLVLLIGGIFALSLVGLVLVVVGSVRNRDWLRCAVGLLLNGAWMWSGL